MPGLLAVIELSFDPTLRLGELAIRWQTIGVTLALLVALAVAALMVPDDADEPNPKSTLPRARPPDQQFPDAPSIDGGDSPRPKRPLRLDDMVLIVAGIVPGAVIGGRLVHAIAFWESYASAPLSFFDPSAGSLSLLGAVIGGTLSGGYVARLVGAPLYRWADAAAVALLLAVGLGKVAQLLGGSGQGLPFDGPWAVAFGGAGPWVASNPGLPSHPSQLYEAAWALAGIPLVLAITGRQRTPRRVSARVSWADRAAPAGQLFVNALIWFLVGRVLMGFTWRDATVVGPLNLEQIAAALVLVALLGSRLQANRRGPPAGVRKDFDPRRI